MAISHVLVATDLSEPARLAYRHAVGFARAFGARLSVLHIDEVYDEDSVDIPAFQRHLAAATARRFERVGQLKRDFAALGAEVDVIVRRGAARAEVARFVDDEHVDLIVLAHHRRSTMDAWVLGSTANRILRIATVPVLVVSVPDEGAVLPIAAVPGYQHLLAPSDLGETSAIGLTASALIAQRFGAQLTALHVRKWPDGADEDAPKVDDAVYGAALGELQAQLAGIDPAPTPAIAFGDRPADRIVSTAGEIGCDLITMPSTGKGTLERIFLGSCAERVCKLSSLPVLVTPVDALARWA